MRTARAGPGLSGRLEERRLLLDVVEEAAAGCPGAVLVHGEAGVGKTALVREVADEAEAHGVQVLWGQALRFGSVESVCLPLVMALESWLRDGPSDRRDQVRAAHPDAAGLLPSLGAGPTFAPTRLVPLVGALVAAAAERAPTMLVVDDVQWAGAASWDALAYVLAGLTGQRLAVVTTSRDEGVAAGDRFADWFADATRLPGVRRLGLGRLDREATRDQVAGLLGLVPGDRLVEQAHERSGGNPYLTELLVADLPPGSEDLPPGVPIGLTRALMGAWRRASDPARDVMRALAVAGRPVPTAALRGVAGAQVDAALREAVGEGLLVVAQGTAWFRHPLLAEALEETFLPGEAAPLHVAWAEWLTSGSAAGLDELQRQGDLALHLEAAGDAPGARAASLRAADLAEQAGARAEHAAHLARAVSLTDADGPPAERVRLLDRAATAHAAVGQARAAYDAWRAARDEVDRDAEPELAARVVRHTAEMEWCLDPHVGTLEHYREAVALAARVPDGAEHAVALAAVADALSWRSRTAEAVATADRAVAVARRSGSAEARCSAHVARATCTPDRLLAEEDSKEALRCALASRSASSAHDAYVTRLNVLAQDGRFSEALTTARAAYAAAEGTGHLPSAAGWLATLLLAAGELEEAGAVVRGSLGALASNFSSARLRVLAAVLAVRQGQPGAAELHRLRAEELVDDPASVPSMEAAALVAELLQGAGRAGDALALLDRVLPAHEVDPVVVEEMLVAAARACADLVEAAGDRRDEDAVVATRTFLAGLLAGRAPAPYADGNTAGPARAALLAAERARAEHAADVGDRWRAAADACATAGLGWERHGALLRLGEHLVKAGAPRSESGPVLRAVREYARSQQARPLLEAVERVAALGRVPLDDPVAPDRMAPVVLAALTAREREVLTHLVACRTNGEIASALFISEKTVSVHVSNLLRKTGTSTRQEVAALAIRVGAGEP